MKSEAEKKYDEACDRYEEKFGERYVISIGAGGPTSFSEAIAEIDKAIASGVPIEKPRYDDDKIY